MRCILRFGVVISALGIFLTSLKTPIDTITLLTALVLAGILAWCADGLFK